MNNQFMLGIPQEDDFSARNLNQFLLGVPADTEMNLNLNSAYLGVDIGHEERENAYLETEGDLLEEMRFGGIYGVTDWTDRSEEMKHARREAELFRKISENSK